MRDTELASEREAKEKFGFLISQNGGWQGWVLLSINIAEKQTPRKEQPWRFTKWYKPAMSKIKLVPTVIFWEVQSPNSFQLEDWQRNNVHLCKAPLPNRSRSLQSEAAGNEVRAQKMPSSQGLQWDRHTTTQTKLFGRAVVLESSAVLNHYPCIYQHGQTLPFWKVSMTTWEGFLPGPTKINKDAALELPAHSEPNKILPLPSGLLDQLESKCQQHLCCNFLEPPLAPTFGSVVAQILSSVSPAEWARVQKCWTGAVNNTSKMRPLLFV